MENIVQLWLQDLRWSCVCEHVTLQSKSVSCPEMQKPKPMRTSKIKNAPESVTVQIGLPTSVRDALLQAPAPKGYPRNQPLSPFTKKREGAVNLADTRTLLETLDGHIYEIQMCLSKLFEITDTTRTNYAVVRTICVNKLPPLITNLDDTYRCFRNNTQFENGTDDDDLTEFISRASKEITALASHISHTIPYDANVVVLCADSISELIREMAAEIIFSECLRIKKDVLPLRPNGSCQYLAKLLKLSQRGPGVCVLLIQAGIVPVLIEICEETTDADIQGMTLRILGCIMALPDAIREICEVQKFDSLISLLWTSPFESVRCETAGFIAQIAVHLQISGRISTELKEQQKVLLNRVCDNSPKIARALRTLCQDTNNEEVFLVGTACTSALTLLRASVPIIELLIRNETMEILLQKWKDNVVLSMVTVNQMLSISLSISTQQSGQLHLDTLDVLPEFLLAALNSRSICSEHEKLTVLARIVKKSLAVLARLSRYQLFGEKFLSLQGHRAVGSVMADPDCDEATVNSCWKILQNLRIKF